mmetsp:Transcript_81010/g.234893  ORF Transcript_81010/g.234893 Transcript_81010/m.234893 type:complete len:594 (-) Transcript_81010:163-1944(-)
MGQCSNRAAEDKFDITPCAVSLEKAKSRSSNAVATCARYHHSSSGKRLQDVYEVDGKVLGQGLCGDVVLVRGKLDGRKYAMKTIRKQQVASSKLAQLAQEVEIYLALDHPNIARLHDVYETDTEICLLTECCEGGELYFRLQKRGVYTDADAAEATRQMLRAVGYLHAHSIVHRDLKLENFLYENNESQDIPPQLKLIDFGFAKIWDPSTLMMASCGSIAYVSPDVLSGRGYTNKCDLWSLGVIVWMLLAGYPPFHGDEKLMMSKIKAGEADWSHKSRWKPVSSDAVDLLKRLLTKDAARRLDAQSALRHPWLASRAATEVAVPATLSTDALRSLARYTKASKVRRAVLQLLAHELAPDETRELREMFLAIDKTNQGTICLRDLKEAIRASGGRSPQHRRRRSEREAAGNGAPCLLGAGMPSPRGQKGKTFDVDMSVGDMSPATPARTLRRANSGVLHDLFQVLDANGDDRVYYSDFLAATMEVRARFREDAVRATFARFDADSSGTISLADLQLVLGESFEGAGAEELMAEISRKGKGGKGEITFQEFLRVVEDRDATPTSSPKRGNACRGASPSRRLAFFPEVGAKKLGGC